MPAQRAYGVDQDFYPWSPIVSRPVLRWPDNARVVLAAVVNREHWDWQVPPGTPLAVSPLGGPEGLWSGNQAQFPDIGGWGNHEYGNRVGIFSHPRRARQNIASRRPWCSTRRWPITTRRSSPRA
jgi:hypothetical protein